MTSRQRKQLIELLALLAMLAPASCNFWHKRTDDLALHTETHRTVTVAPTVWTRTIVARTFGPDGGTTSQTETTERRERDAGFVTEDQGLDLRAHKSDEGKTEAAVPWFRIAASVVVLALVVFAIVRSRARILGLLGTLLARSVRWLQSAPSPAPDQSPGSHDPP